MNRFYYILTGIILLNFSANGQELKQIVAELGNSYEYSVEEQKNWEKALKLLNQINDFTIDYETLSAENKSLIDQLEIGEGPVAEWGDTWNSVAYPYKIEVSSELKTNSSSNYKSLNLKDNNLLTAWVPNCEKLGVGEKVTFYFRKNNPRVNTINVFNGYLKNKKLWTQNSRVKTMKMFVNEKEYATLKFKDQPACQVFKFESLQTKDRDLIITLEILEIYPGSKWNDVAISEITFDGLDVF
ncbi:MAG: hypothetical protein ACERIH_08785 [Labilibaculum antarcticum]